MPKCTILVGVPASGKSTWHRNKFGEYPPAVASTDKIIEAVASSYGMTYDEGFKGLIQFAEQIMWRQITTCLMRGNDFIIDRTNLLCFLRLGRKLFRRKNGNAGWTHVQVRPFLRKLLIG